MPSAQCWILTIEHTSPQEVHGLLTVCGTTTNGEPESYELGPSSNAILEESGSVLDATIWSFLAIADGTAAMTGGQPAD